MKKIFKILSKSTVPIVIVFVMLGLQAICDLTLPEYTSKIVNVGIQQSGINDKIPKAITEKELNNILLLVDEKDKSTVLDNYKLINKNDQKYIKKYKALEKGNVYILNKISDSKKVEISKIIKTPLLINMIATSDNANIKKELKIGKNIDGPKLIASLPKNVRDNIIKEVNTNLDKMGDTLVNQMVVESIKRIYDNAGMDLNRIQVEYVAKIGIQMVLTALFVMILTITVTYLSARIAARFSRDLRSRVVRKVMSFSNKEYDELGASSLITRSTNDIQQIQTLVIMLLRIAVYAPIVGIGAFLKVRSSSMSWVIGVAVLAILCLVIVLFTVALPKFQVIQKKIDKINLIAREILTGLPVIRAFANEKHEEKRFDDANKDLTKVNLFVNRLMSIMMPSMMFIMNGICVLIIWVGAEKVNAGNIQVGTLMAFITYTMQVIISFVMISMISIMAPRAFVSMKRVAEVLNKKVSIKDKENTLEFNKEKEGIVEFKDVYFRYPDAEEDVLENISFTAKPGTTTAFIGSTGSGKSTLVNLIPRFFDVTGGKILIDGVDIRDVKLFDLRKKIGYVPQKGMLFSGTIKSNIAFGLEDININEIKEASKISQSIEFIKNKKEKYDSEISQGGTNVSGGQKQRLSIARAIAKKPGLFIFDDSFSALDYKTDYKLRDALNKSTKNSTIFIVAQRISTVINADQIIVLDDGKIVGIGNHKELMKNCEVYKEIASSQLSKEELINE